MTASTRFLGFAVLAWAGVRAVSLGVIPIGGARATDVPPPPLAQALPPVPATEFAPLDLVADGGGTAASGPAPASGAVERFNPTAGAGLRPPPASFSGGPAYYALATPRARSPAMVRYVEQTLMPEPRSLPFSGDPVPPGPPPMKLASTAVSSPPVAATVPAADALAPAFVRRSKRLELSTWAMTRGKPGQILGPNSLAANGATLGGSQAGARLTYWIDRHLGASLRVSTPLGGARGGEAGLGVRYRPFFDLPFSVTAERRQRFGRAGGRNDFAMFVEGGVWDRPLPVGFRLDAYAQAGVVGIKRHDLFGDGAFTLTRPIWRNISGGFGVWGGAQPHLYRVDAGPRLTIAMKHGMRIHADYRQRLAGSAFPSSGVAVTIAGDF